jgi:glycosyltransferase 2 family protein
MKKRFITILQYTFFFLLGLLFVWLTLKDVNKSQWLNIKSAVLNARQWVIIPVIFMILLSHFSRAIRWKILMEPLGYHPSTFNTFAAVMIGYLVNAGVPRLGEVVKCTMLSRYENVRADKLVGTIVVERAFDAFCLLLVFIMTMFIEGEVIGEYMLNMARGFFEDESGNISTTKILMVIGGIFIIIFLIYHLLKRFGHIDAIAKFKNVLYGIWLGLNSFRFIKNKKAFLFHTLFIWAMYLFSTTAGLYALRETDHLGIGVGLATLVIGSVGMIVTPGGIGAYPWLIEKLMGLYQVTEETGKTLGWLLWSAQTIIILLGGVICFALITYYNKKK